MEIKSRVVLMTKPGNLKGIASISLDDEFVVKGLRVYEGQKGLFVSMPSTKVGDEYRNDCFPLTKECWDKVHDAVINAYQLALKQEEQSHETKGVQKSEKNSKGSAKPQKSDPKQKSASVSKELPKERQEPEIEESMEPSMGM